MPKGDTLTKNKIASIINNIEEAFMIVWLDGTCGVGKSTVAKELNKKIGNKSNVFDPDMILVECPTILLGGGVKSQNNIRFLKKCQEEIQELHESDRILIIPMALTETNAKSELLEYFEKEEHIHIILSASRAILESRIKGDQNRDKKFALNETDGNMFFLRKYYPNDIVIDTDNKCVKDIANEVYRYIEQNSHAEK